MIDGLKKNFDTTNAIVGGAVWLFVIIIYFLTKAPTLSFWDCGEFIATSHILGIPHPPGTPLYILWGRLFSILPFWSDISVRVNMFSAVCSSFTALFGYLIIVRILRSWFDADNSIYTKLLIYAGGASGAFFAAFSFTNWNNSVEAEVYGMAMMMTMMLLWMSLIYYQHRETQFAGKLMAIIVFVGFMGIGVHMTVFIAILIAGLFFVLKKSAPQSTWFAIALFLGMELYYIYALSSRPGEIPYYVPVVIVAIFYFFYIFSYEQIPRLHLIISGAFLLAALPVFESAYKALKNKNNIEVASLGGMSTVEYIGIGFVILLNLFALFLIARYFKERHKNDSGTLNLIPAIFIVVMSVMIFLLNIFKGYHPFLIVSAISLVALLAFIRQHINWSILIALVGIATIVIGLKEFMYGIIFSGVIVILLGLIKKVPDWKPALIILLCAAAGFSVHLFIPIRSAQQPNINENNPSASLNATINFLERKQYGSQGMVERMFKRRAEWENQFGDSRRMGFWHFFKEQFGIKGPSVVFFVLLGVFGMWEIARKKPKIGLPFILFLIFSSVGLILYMNFADGMRQHPVTGADYMEVRDRDYFFTPAYIIFGLSIGLGLAVLIQTIRKGVSTFTDGPKKIILASLTVLFLLPVFTLAKNYHVCDRSDNLIPYDYGWNLLESTPQNGILLTHGDNDTFPLWCLQEAYGIRLDVTVINLSLANTDWYIKQIRTVMGLDLGWTDADVDKLRPFRTPDGTRHRIQDIVSDAVIESYYGKRPVCFSVTVGSGARQYKGQPLDQMLTMNGMVWVITEAKKTMVVDVDESFDFFINPNRFKTRGINDPAVYKDETTSRLTRNYGNAFLMVADTLRKAGDFERAEKLIRKAIDKIPHAGDPVDFLATLYEQQGKIDELKLLVENSVAGDHLHQQILLVRAYRAKGEVSTAEMLIRELFSQNHSHKPIFDEMMRLFYSQRDVDNIHWLFKEWLNYNPHDNEVKEMLKQFEAGYKIKPDDSGDQS